MTHYLALATDYDGTLATVGQVSETTLAAIDRWRKSGRKLILVTGRYLDDLYTIFPQVDQCDYVVAENGALLHHPATQESTILGTAPPVLLNPAMKVCVATQPPHTLSWNQSATPDLFAMELQAIG